MLRSGGRKSCLAAACCLAAFAQDAAQVTDWQTAAGGKRPFRPPNFPRDPGDAFRPVGGRFSADFPLSTYTAFAYKLSLSSDQRQAMLAHLPEWVATDRYAIEARAEGSPTKDQMRLMVQSLLAERFQFAAHFEGRSLSAFAPASSNRARRDQASAHSPKASLARTRRQRTSDWPPMVASSRLSATWSC